MSEKKPKIMVATNIYQVDPTVYAGHMQLWYHLGKQKDRFDIMFFGPWRLPIDIARNKAAEFALYHQCDYLFFYDDDMFFEDGSKIIGMIDKMIDSGDTIHILQALAFIRGYPFHPMFFKLTENEGGKHMLPLDDYRHYVREDGLVEGDATGCCCTLIDMRLFKHIPKPWFLTGSNHTEDIYFCVKAKQYLGNVGIFMDTTVEIGHLLEKVVLTNGNRDMLIKMYKEYNVNQLFLPDPTFINQIQAKDACNDPVMKEHPFDLVRKIENV